MLTAVSITRFRGIRQGRLEGLTPLVVLLGPNGCGKSTILEALYIGASNAPQEAVGRCVWRRTELWSGARWLLFEAGLKGGAAIAVEGAGGQRRIKLEVEPGDLHPEIKQPTVPGGPPYSMVRLAVANGGEEPRASALIVFHSSNSYTIDAAAPLDLATLAPEARLIEARPDRSHAPLHRIYSAAVEQGRREEVEAWLSDLVPGFVRIELLAPVDTPVVHIVFKDRSVPVALAGDGVQAFVRQCLELASLPAGVVLLEEPEAFKHPAALQQTARAILSAMRRGVQIVLSTHSIELVDALLGASEPQTLDALSVYRLLLRRDELAMTRISGPDVAFRRLELVEDLR